MAVSVTFRFYEELNDFLPAGKRKRSFTLSLIGSPSVKDTIESIGVPHTEVDLILVNGFPSDLDYRLADGDRISVYPVFETIDIRSIKPGTAEPLRVPKFILDVHLGRLAKYMRMLGFDTYYRNDLDDPEIIQRSVDEHRIILTRDRGILKNSRVTHGYFVRSQKPSDQIQEVIRRFDLKDMFSPFSRCIACNGIITAVDKKEITHRLQPLTRKYYHSFYRCGGCGRIYWEGSHFERMAFFIRKAFHDVL